MLLLLLLTTVLTTVLTTTTHPHTPVAACTMRVQRYEAFTTKMAVRVKTKKCHCLWKVSQVRKGRCVCVFYFTCISLVAEAGFGDHGFAPCSYPPRQVSSPSSQEAGHNPWLTPGTHSLLGGQGMGVRRPPVFLRSARCRVLRGLYVLEVHPPTAHGQQ